MSDCCLHCFFLTRCKPDKQITVAGYMSTAYAILMLAVTVGIVVQTSQDSWTSPNAMFIVVITAIFVLAGLLHPEEFMCLMPGTLYFLCIPSGRLLNRCSVGHHHSYLMQQWMCRWPLQHVLIGGPLFAEKKSSPHWRPHMMCSNCVHSFGALASAVRCS